MAVVQQMVEDGRGDDGVAEQLTPLASGVAGARPRHPRLDPCRRSAAEAREGATEVRPGDAPTANAAILEAVAT